MENLSLIFILFGAYFLLVPLSRFLKSSKKREKIKEYSIFIGLFFGAGLHYLYGFPNIILVGGLFGLTFKFLLMRSV